MPLRNCSLTHSLLEKAVHILSVPHQLCAVTQCKNFPSNPAAWAADQSTLVSDRDATALSGQFLSLIYWKTYIMLLCEADYSKLSAHEMDVPEEASYLLFFSVSKLISSQSTVPSCWMLSLCWRLLHLFYSYLLFSSYSSSKYSSPTRPPGCWFHKKERLNIFYSCYSSMVTKATLYKLQYSLFLQR